MADWRMPHRIFGAARASFLRGAIRDYGPGAGGRGGGYERLYTVPHSVPVLRSRIRGNFSARYSLQARSAIRHLGTDLTPDRFQLFQFVGWISVFQAASEVIH